MPTQRTRIDHMPGKAGLQALEELRQLRPDLGRQALIDYALITALSALLAIPPAQIATIGDMPNDVLMFERSGLSIAMANASADVQRAAMVVTASNTEEGFALAMERFILQAHAA